MSTTEPNEDRFEKAIIGALALRAKNGRHMHHSECIHNLTPDEQIELLRRRMTREQYIQIVGMPVQITPDDWEIDAPHLLNPKEKNHE